MDIFEATRKNELEELAAALVTSHPDITDDHGSTLLIIACYYNNKEAVALLIAANADPDLQDRMGNTALMGACFKGHEDIVSMLLNGGALVDKQNGNLATALTFAATFGHSAIVRQLLERGADPLIKDRHGKNPVDHAKVQENELCYELLATAANKRLDNSNN
jgi:ankyrin repeat protein